MTQKKAIEWIAENDDVENSDLASVKEQMTVIFAADMLGVPAYKLAFKILRYRVEHGLIDSFTL